MIPARLVHGLSMARSGLYFLEALPVLAFNRYAHPDILPPTPEQLKTLWKNISDLHEKDARNVAEGLYSWRTLDIENPWTHFKGFADVLSDGVKVAWRMRRRKTKDFSRADVREQAEEAPEYYSRNFHFQTDGYFSENSARRYDHQVEILFNGTAGAMRRMILPPLTKNLSHPKRILEIGSGAGSATRLLATTFPSARITALDLSAPYLKVAQENLKAFPKIDFLQGDGTDLEFKDETFDAVISVYTFHEWPRKERETVIREAFRVLKPNGILVFADSLQMDDQPDLNWALERFPKIYHEPFYKDYLNNPLEKMVFDVTGAETNMEHALFTKVVSARKPGRKAPGDSSRKSRSSAPGQDS